MHQKSLSKLLDLLGASEESAAGEYLRLHQRLSRFLEWNGATDPEHLADEAFERLCRRLDEADGIEAIRNPAAFALGVARLLLQEEYKRQQRESAALLTWQTPDAVAAAQAEVMDEALQHCLGRLPSDRSRLIERYYTFGDRKKSEIHRSLAKELGISAHALRNRALRARRDLEECMRRFLSRQSP